MPVHDVAGQPTQPETAASEWVLGGRYRVLDRLGQGGMADVFRAHDDLLDRDVAVKVFRTLQHATDVDTHAELRRELELQSLAQLSHPHLITLFDGSISGDGPGYLVLELVPGSDLATRLHDGPLPEPLARQVCAQLADALAYVHAHGMVHRDVKPANILLGSDGQPGSVRARLSDFGIVRMIGSERMTAADQTLGTASYVAPEQALGANVEPPADVYSLGLVMIEALTGTRCFDGPLHEALAARLVTPPMIPQGLASPWPTLVAAMTAIEPEHRPTAQQVADALRNDSPSGLFVPPAPAAPPPPPLRPPGEPSGDWYPVDDRPRRYRAGLLLAVLALAAIVAGAAYFLMSGNAQPPAGPTPPPAVHKSGSQAPRHHSTGAGAVVQSVAPQHPKHARKHQPAAPRPSARSTAPLTSHAAPPPSPSSSPAPSSPTPSPTPTSPAPTTSASTSAAAP